MIREQNIRIGLGCMRLSTELADDPELGFATITAALDAGFERFDTARAYAPGEADLGHNERLLARVLRAHPRGEEARVITKCGMRRDGGAWIPDGRATRIIEDATASVKALDGIPIDVLLLHAPDPRVPLSTSARALARVVEDKVARRAGVSNVSRKQLEEVAAHVPIACVEVALGAYDDLPIRSGVAAYCIERGIPLLAHASLGGPERARRLARDPELAPIAARYEVGSADLFLAYLLAVRPEIIPIVGARNPETVRCLKKAASLRLDDADLERIDARFPGLASLRRPITAAPPRDAEIVMIMGIAGAGKSCAAEAYGARGYERLNRDTTGGTLRAIAERLEERLADGGRRFVLDNTYVTRASRSDVLQAAARHGARVRCVYHVTSLHDAQVNVVLRMLERFGRVLMPEEISSLAKNEPAALAPHSLSRMTRDLEPPMPDEGFSEITPVPFVRNHPADRRPGLIVPLAALEKGASHERELLRIIADGPEGAPCLLFAWKPGADESSFAAVRSAVEHVSQSTGRSIEIAYCPHPGGPPICWCRPPLPGLFLAFAHRHAIHLPASFMYAASPSDRAVAQVLGATLRPYDPPDSISSRPEQPHTED